MRDQCTHDPDGWCQLRTDGTGLYARRGDHHISTWLPDKIPAELKALPQWVIWRPQGDKKVPINPKTGKPASINDPSTWGTYLEAKGRDSDRLGFVLTGDDPYVGIDRDHCRDSISGNIEPGAWKSPATSIATPKSVQVVPASTP